jgi:hypothetical protein
VEAKMATVAILTVRDALEVIAEDEARQSYEQRNRELLAAERAKRGEWAKDPIGTRSVAVVQLALWPAAPAVWHSTDKLNAELVQRAVATIVHRLAVRAGVPRGIWTDFWWVAPVYMQAEIAWRRMKRGLPEQLVARSHEGKSLTLVGGQITDPNPLSRRTFTIACAGRWPSPGDE